MPTSPDEELMHAESPEHIDEFVGQQPFTQQLTPQTSKLHPPPPPPPVVVEVLEVVLELPLDEDELLE